MCLRLHRQLRSLAHPVDLPFEAHLPLPRLAMLTEPVGQAFSHLHSEYAHFPAHQLRALYVQREDHIARWAVAYVLSNQSRGLPPMLDAVLDRWIGAIRQIRLKHSLPGEGYTVSPISIRRTTPRPDCVAFRRWGSESPLGGGTGHQPTGRRPSIASARRIVCSPIAYSVSS